MAYPNDLDNMENQFDENAIDFEKARENQQ